MQVESFLLERVQIPLKIKFSQSNNTTSFSDSMILSIKTINGIIGLGEACPRTYVTGESPESIEDDLRRISNLLKNWTFSTVDTIRNFVLNILSPKIGPSSICSIELALLDAWSKEQQKPIDSLLNIQTQETLQYSGVIPMCSIAQLPPLLAQIKNLGFQSLKLKVGTDLDDSLNRINLIKSVFPAAISIRIDANTSWNLSIAQAQIPAFLKVGVTHFEQIFPKGKEQKLAKITKVFGKQARISVDESFTDRLSLNMLLQMKACNHFNFKISKVGGIFHALEAYHLIKSHGYTAQLGAHFGETSILTRAGMLFALLVKDLTDLEGGYGELLLQKDLIQPSFTINHLGQLHSSILKQPFCQRRDQEPVALN